MTPDYSVQNNGGTTLGGVTGRGFLPGQTGNAGGRPKGLARRVRDLVPEDELIEWCLACVRGVLPDGTKTDAADRRWAVNWLAERGWGKPARFQLIEDDDPLEAAADRDAVVELFIAEVARLSGEAPEGDGPADSGDYT